jgi:hypothetical protein
LVTPNYYRLTNVKVVSKITKEIILNSRTNPLKLNHSSMSLKLLNQQKQSHENSFLKSVCENEILDSRNLKVTKYHLIAWKINSNLISRMLSAQRLVLLFSHFNSIRIRIMWFQLKLESFNSLLVWINKKWDFSWRNWKFPFSWDKINDL